MYTNSPFKRAHVICLGNLHQQETEEIVVYTHGIAMKAAFAGPKKPQDEDQKPIKMRNRRASLSPPR